MEPNTPPHQLMEHRRFAFDTPTMSPLSLTDYQKKNDCICLCHSRKVTTVIFDNMSRIQDRTERENRVLSVKIDKLQTLIDKMDKLTKRKESKSAEIVAQRIVNAHNKREKKS